MAMVLGLATALSPSVERSHNTVKRGVFICEFLSLH
jgi:hypothetical protein